MKKQLFALLLIAPMLVLCSPSSNSESNGEKEGENQNEQENQEPKPAAPKIYLFDTTKDTKAPAVNDGDDVLATNPNVEKFLSEVTYPDKDWSYTKIYDYYGGFNEVKYNENGEPDENGSVVTDPVSDIPPSYSISWTAGDAADTLDFHLAEGDWEMNIKLKGNCSFYNVSNLVPNTHYTYKVSNTAGTVLAEGCFDTHGHLRQAFFKKSNNIPESVRNCRDLGGWQTLDGKTVKFHKIYRGGRMQSLENRCKEEILAEGIGGQLDLRNSDALASPAIKGMDFCAPKIEEGGTSMLSNMKGAKVKQCFEFVVKCLREGKGVYFHCSLGRDRTGTFDILLLGLLGVREGDISKAYEVSYFAPKGYSIALSEDETKFFSNRTTWVYEPVAKYFWNKAGKTGTFADGCETYLLGIGVSQQDIDDYRSIMLK